ncbi:hypothetical protein C9439_00260 [archaeon SCG-AAA382B04]|nr:hypothetical protein C9439_00260 [archaeon SCG-AAA382B04]
MDFDKTILNVLKQRYLLRDQDGNVTEEPEEMFERVAEDIAKANKQYDDDKRSYEEEKKEFTEAMKKQRFMPNSPTLMNAGGELQQLAACFVIPVPDSMSGIYQAVKDTALIHQSGGGCIGKECFVLTENGPINIKELVEDGKKASQVVSYSDNGMQFNQIYQRHTNKLESDRIYEVEFESSKVKASDWHPFFVWNGSEIIQKRADELKKGDVVIGSNKWDGQIPKELDRRAWLHGFIIADGSFDDSKNGVRLRICNSHEELVSKTADQLGIGYRKSGDDRYESDLWVTSKVGEEAKEIAKEMDIKNIEKVNCYNKRLPSYIWKSDTKKQLSMLLGLIEGDGWWNKEKNELCYSTVNDDLKKDVEALCGLLGIRTRSRRKESKKVNEQTMNETYLKASPWLVEFFNKHSDLYQDIDYNWSNGQVPLDLEYKKKLEKETELDIRSTKAWRQGLDIDGHKVALQRWFLKGIIPRNSAALILRKLGENKLAGAIHSSRIVQSVEKSDEDDVLYDLTVPGQQNYLAGNDCYVVVHNTGFSFSRIRPEGDLVKSTGGKASGPLSFLSVFNESTNTVMQGGKRRGANMGILHVSHPDIYDWVTAKEDEESYTNFNMSVAVDEEFMEAVKNEEDYELINPRNGETWNTVDAKELFDEICKQAHENGEPGIIFLDKINEENPFPAESPRNEHYIEATNPCLTGDMKIAVADGEREEVTIRELAEEGGDVAVYSLNEEGELEIQMGRNPRKTREDVKILKIHTDVNIKIKCTEDHKIQTKENRFVEARDIEEDMKIICFDKKQEKTVESTVISVREVGHEEVYNITVDENHNYFCGMDTKEGETKNVYINVKNCGEQPLEPYGACNLGHINLSKCYDGDSGVDWGYLGGMVDLGVRFLDNVIDRSDYPIEGIEEKVSENRKIGLGVMGWHDLLMELEIPYDSEKAIELAREVMEFINKEAHEKSMELAEDRGGFPAFDESIYDEPIRNATLTTIAPTGTTSMIASCSSGIEPVFALTYQKKVMDDEKVTRTNDILESKLRERDLWDEDVREKIKNKGSILDVDEVPGDLKDVFKTAMEIDPEWHIRMQAAFQVGTDDAVSKTINFDQDASVEDIKGSYLLAYEEGCKGLTVYRDRSRDEQALETEESLEGTGRLESYDRNNWLSGETKEMKMGCQKNLFVTCNSDDGGNLREVFGVLGKPGGCVRSFADALGIVISIALQEGVDPKDIIRKLKMIRCPNPDTLSENKKYSCPDAIARTMEDYINSNGDGDEINVETSAGNLPECPDCGGSLVFEEGCVKCHSCGYSKC